RADRCEPAVERGQVRFTGDRDRPRGDAQRRDRGYRRDEPRAGHPSRRPAIRFRAVCAVACGAGRQDQRTRPGPVYRQGPGRGPRRTNLGRERAGRCHRVPRRASARRPRGASGHARRGGTGRARFRTAAGAVMTTYVFPPALVQLIRKSLTPKTGCLLEIVDDELVQLLTTIFFAGLETYEGDHYPISVAFLGRTFEDLVIPEGTVGALPLYRWKILRFASPRPFSTRELVKLAAMGSDARIHAAVAVLDDGTLGIAGLAREGFSTGPDPFLRIVASRPGCLSIRSGHDRLLEYERGTIVTVDDDAVFSAGPVSNALRAIARSAGVDEEVVPRYVDAIGFLVREMVAHGHGGILIVSADERPAVAETAPYKMTLDSSLSALIRLAWRAGGAPTAESPAQSEASGP